MTSRRRIVPFCLLLLCFACSAALAEDVEKQGVYEYVVRAATIDFDAASAALIDKIENSAYELVAKLGERFPKADVLTASAKHGDGTDEWFDRLLEAECDYGPTMELDYRLYAEGEALLGWLNATATVRADDEFDANALLVDLAKEMRGALDARGLEIAHLKMTLDSPEAGGQLAALSITSSDGDADLREALIDGVRAGELIVNLRAEADPTLLFEITRDVLATCARSRPSMAIEMQHHEHFRPAPPTPTHRASSEDAARLARAASEGTR